MCALNAVWCLPAVNDEVGDLCEDTANYTPNQTFSEFFLKNMKSQCGYRIHEIF